MIGNPWKIRVAQVGQDNRFTPELARAIANIKADPDLQSHVNLLATKANDGSITAAEDAEYKALVDAADLIAVLQLKARRFLARHSA